MPEPPLSLPTLLLKSHEVAGFDCGKAPLNEFLSNHAWQNQAGGGPELTSWRAAVAWSVTTA